MPQTVPAGSNNVAGLLGLKRLMSTLVQVNRLEIPFPDRPCQPVCLCFSLSEVQPVQPVFLCIFIRWSCE